MKKLLTLALTGGCALVIGVTFSGPIFDHSQHEDLECDYCHAELPIGPNWEAPMPDREVCMDCHDDENLPPAADYPASHVGDYRHQHQFDARADGGDCAVCHRNSEKCSVCHHGENVDFLAHDRNWRFTHPLTHYKGTEDCRACHFTETFCQDCHAQYGVQPGNHFVSGWTRLHAEQARNDLTTCIQCHGGPSPVCRECHD